MLVQTVNLFTPLWLLWGVFFCTVEGTALWARSTKRYKGNGTLSALVWRFIEHHPKQRLLVVIGWVTLTGHFFFHIP